MKYKINKGLITQKINNETVIFDGDESVLYSFNDTASFIFKQLSQGKDKNIIIKALVRQFDVEVATAEKDVDALLKDMTAKRIISSK